MIGKNPQAGCRPARILTTQTVIYGHFNECMDFSNKTQLPFNYITKYRQKSIETENIICRVSADVIARLFGRIMLQQKTACEIFSASRFSASLILNDKNHIIFDPERGQIFHESAEFGVAKSFRIKIGHFRTELLLQFAQIIALCAVSPDD